MSIHYFFLTVFFVGSNIVVALAVIIHSIIQIRNRPRYKRQRKLYTKSKIKPQKREKLKKQKKKVIHPITCKNPECHNAIYLYYDKCKDCLIKEGFQEADY